MFIEVNGEFDEIKFKKIIFRQDMEILIVSSSTDVHSSAIYPTHPYSSKMQQKNLVFLPDPCILNVNGVTIAMTATDIYNHILDTEIAM